jgi:hypothetical protein
MINEMEKEFANYNQSLALKELGMNEHIFGVYGKRGGILYQVVGDEFDAVDHIHFIKAPLKQQVFKFFREKGYDITIQHNKKYVAIVYSSVKNFSIDEYDTYEEAENALIDKLILLAKQQDNGRTKSK